MAPFVRAGLLAGVLTAATTLAAPAAAAPAAAPGLDPLAPDSALGVFAISRPDPAGSRAHWRCRWGCGWGGYGGWRRNRVDAGDVLIGAAIIGGAIAIANANNRRQRERDVVIVEREVREPDWRDDDRRYDDRRYDPSRDDRRAAPRGSAASGLDNAVNQCLDRIERDVRVDRVDNVDRTASGWQVSGALFNGAPFQCRIGNDGRIDTVDYGAAFRDMGYTAAPDVPVDAVPAPGQWDADSYASARAALGGTVRPDLAVQEAAMTAAPAPGPVRTAGTTAMPAYPGGPIPGEVIPETIDGAM